MFVRYWFSQKVAAQVAHTLAVETQTRQRVEACDPAGNPWGCPWQIVPVPAEPLEVCGVPVVLDDTLEPDTFRIERTRPDLEADGYSWGPNARDLLYAGLADTPEPPC